MGVKPSQLVEMPARLVQTADNPDPMRFKTGSVIFMSFFSLQHLDESRTKRVGSGAWFVRLSESRLLLQHDAADTHSEVPDVIALQMEIGVAHQPAILVFDWGDKQDDQVVFLLGLVLLNRGI